MTRFYVLINKIKFLLRIVNLYKQTRSLNTIPGLLFIPKSIQGSFIIFSFTDKFSRIFNFLKKFYIKVIAYTSKYLKPQDHNAIKNHLKS